MKVQFVAAVCTVPAVITVTGTVPAVSFFGAAATVNDVGETNTVVWATPPTKTWDCFVNRDWERRDCW